eukprot:1600598-Amphidinium_carterae.1
MSLGETLKYVRVCALFWLLASILVWSLRYDGKYSPLSCMAECGTGVTVARAWMVCDMPSNGMLFGRL